MTEQKACTLCGADGQSSPAIIINGNQLRNALEFLAPDNSPEQLSEDLVIELHAKDEDFPEAGLYAYHNECPEEGAVFLDSTAHHPEQAEGAQGEREDVIADRNYVAGMQAGWNFAESADEAGFKRAIDSRLAGIRAALAQPSPAPELELELPESCGPMPEINFANYGEDEVKALQDWAFAATDELTAFDRIVATLQTQLAMALDAAAKGDTARQQCSGMEMEIRELRGAAEHWESESRSHQEQRDAAQARVAELEKQEPVATVYVDIDDFGTRAEIRVLKPHLQIDTKLYAAPVAQAGQVPDVDDLANFIRFTDGNHKMGAGVLAERICDWLGAPQPVKGDGHE